jgi:hypothetical protein
MSRKLKKKGKKLSKKENKKGNKNQIYKVPLGLLVPLLYRKTMTSIRQSTHGRS